MGALWAFLQANPALFSGFVGGVLGAVVVGAVSWRWAIVRRRHDDE